MIAFAAGLIAMALLRPRKQALVAAVVLILASVVALLPGTRTGKSFAGLVTAARHHQYEKLSSERLVPILTAIEMTKAHPVTGVGPGAFKYQFMPERIAIKSIYPRALTRGFPQNFGETHNDHLQVAAETGLPGYALFLTAIGVLALPLRRYAREAPATPRQRFAHALRAPLAVTFFVLTLAQFPLQVAAPRMMFLALAALARGWDRPDE